ncbi:monovalent cation:proton antiporter family protein [Desertibacillus haloalkaliphilus]|uniref:monovalent cation:proton antiporter family protein n=1 Tax=Desertibacillus haloalkaliphilus TaxID=1328930 RepID=UPI001C261756|nr:cation:proton antiporter family protein [Desertibacillus haloalkaliphilus]MBU8906897.1 cation:proton antiporter [Desertibacillus haloalkaliphilus]
MEAEASVISLFIVVITAFLIPVLLHKFRLNVIPVVVAEIIAGIIIGKSGFNLVSQDMWLETLSLLGFIFLMFLSGLEIDFSAFASKQKARILKNGKKEPNAFMLASLIFVFVFGLSYLLSLAFVVMGFVDNAFLMTLIISTISLGVVVPTLKEENLMKTTVGQTILLVAIIADLVTMILLAVFVSIYSPDEGNMWLLLLLFAVGVLLYLIGKKFSRQSYLEAMKKGTIQIDTRAIFMLIILLVALSETVGAKNILGAFLAGVLVSLLSPNPELVRKLDSFGYGFLIPIFFVMVGVDLDIWQLFDDRSVMLLIPLLFIALLISKVVPALVLKRWYDWKTVIGAGFLLTSTLSLVIAAATVGESIGIIDSQLSSALILVAVISCLVTPVVFKKVFPKQATEQKREKLAIVGANQLTLPLSVELDQNRYQSRLFHTKQQKINELEESTIFAIEEIEEFEIEILKERDVFSADILIVATGDQERNYEIAMFASDYGVPRVIARIERPELENELRERGINVFSVFFSNQAVLRALVESPSVVELLTKRETGLHEIDVKNSHYSDLLLREFPYLGDTVFVRIFRENESLIPHGDTVIKTGDRIIVSGSQEHVDKLRQMLST